MSVIAGKPIPLPEPDDLPFWEGLRASRLLLYRCDGCGSYEQRAHMVCPKCAGETFTWSPVSGRGTIYSYTVARQTWVSGFEQDLPYVVVAVAMDEQTDLLITTNLIGDYDIDALDIGLPVVAAFEPRGDGTLLQFRLVG